MFPPTTEICDGDETIDSTEIRHDVHRAEKDTEPYRAPGSRAEQDDLRQTLHSRIVERLLVKIEENSMSKD